MRGVRATTWGCVERSGRTQPVLPPARLTRSQSTRPQPAPKPPTVKLGLESVPLGPINKVRFKRVTVTSDPGRHEGKEESAPKQKPGTVVVADMELKLGEAPSTWRPARILHNFLETFGKQEPKIRRILAGLNSDDKDVSPPVARNRLRQRLAHNLRTAEDRGMLAYFGDEWLQWKKLAKEVSDQELDSWAWILSADNPDAAIERFISGEKQKPPFLLSVLVGQDCIIRRADNFLSLLTYIFKRHINPLPAAHDQPSFRLTWMRFVVLLKGLSFHCLQSWPKLLPSVSRLTVAFIESMPDEIQRSRAHAQAIRCEVFNQALRIFGQSPAINPLDDMVFNWEAQKILLGLSSRLQPSLYITRDGYRSIRRVMAALPKSFREREVAQRASKTWPPYRKDWDGRDERRRTEDDLSRVVRAGILQREAGYSPDHVDRALDVIGGSTVGSAPSIQTRALLPPLWRDDKAGLNIYNEWVARIRATRNRREAWSAFNNPPRPDLLPNGIVYTEIFEKLFAREVHDPSGLTLPGDGREVFPVYNGNLSAIEIARVTPPDPKELYQMMLFSGVRPTGNCLAILVKNSESKEVALQFLGDSPYRHLVSALRKSEFSSPDSASFLPQLPIEILYAWITMLCRTHTRQPNRRPGGGLDASTHIEEAIRLASAYYKHKPIVSETDRVPWYIILEALANDKVIYSCHGPQHNLSRTLSVFMNVWQRLVRVKGVDEKLFELLCKVVRKSLRLVTFKDTKTGKVHLQNGPYHERLLESRKRQFLQVYTYLRETFKELTAPMQDFSVTDDGSMTTAHKMTARHVYHYMRALGVIGDGPGMVSLMRWIYDAWDKEYLLQAARDPEEPGYDHIIRTFTYFTTVGPWGVEADVIRDLQERLEHLRVLRGCSWFWPESTKDEVVDAEIDITVAEQWSEVRELLDSDDNPLVSKMTRQATMTLRGGDGPLEPTHTV